MSFLGLDLLYYRMQSHCFCSRHPKQINGLAGNCWGGGSQIVQGLYWVMKSCVWSSWWVMLILEWWNSVSVQSLFAVGNCCFTWCVFVILCRALYAGLRQPRCLLKGDMPVWRGLGGTNLWRTYLPLSLCWTRPVQGREVWVQPWMGRGPLHHW